MPLKRLLLNLKSLKCETDYPAIENYIDLLIQNSDQTKPEDFEDKHLLEECLECITKVINNLSQGSASEKIIFLKLLFLLEIQKLNIFPESDQTFYLRLSALNDGCILLDLCCSNYCVLNIEYFISECLCQIQKLENFFDGKNSSHLHTLKNKKTLLNLYRIENKINENQHQEALHLLKEQKKNVAETKTMLEYFIGLCYNLSLKFKNENNVDTALDCLYSSLDLFKAETLLPRSMKQIIYLLLHLCAEHNKKASWSHAVRALDLLKRSDIDMLYVMNKLKVSTMSGQRRLCEEVLEEALEWKDMKLDNVKAIMSYLSKHDLTSRALEFVWKLRHKQFSPNEKFALMEMELGIYLSKNDDRAISLVENMLSAAREVLTPYTESLYRVLASHAAKKFQVGQLKECLQWYKFCAELSDIRGLDEAFHQRVDVRICLCYLEMNEYQLAAEYFHRLNKTNHEEDSLYIYVALLIALTSGNEALVTETLSLKAVNCKNTENILASCCHKAFVSGNKGLAKKCLERIIHQGSNGSKTLLTAKVSRCFLCFQALDSSGWDREASEKYMRCLEQALNDLQQNPANPQVPELSLWFSRAAWNLALTSGTQPRHRFQFFLHCCCFSELASEKSTWEKDSMMLAAAAGLEIVRKGEADSDREEILKKVMTLIDRCKSLETGSNVSLLRLLYAYEFEARCHAEKESDGLENFRKISHQPFVDAETLKKVAATANAYLTNKYKVITEALKLATVKVSENGHNSSEASKIYHSLIEVLFYIQEYNNATMEEENWQICNNLLKLIENTFEDYPELEVLWLMAKCWNWGIQKLILNDTKRAYKWCTLAMDFLKKLGSLKVLHEKRLSDMYITYFPSQVKAKVSTDQ